jgi:PII-like signaling protein
MALIEQARQQGLLGATVTRGVAGFGRTRHGEIHTARIFELASDLPLVVTIIDTAEIIANFLPVVQQMVKQGIITQGTVTVVHQA